MERWGEVRAVVFDLDDTLYPEVQYVRSGFWAVAKKLACAKHSEQAVFELLWGTFEQGDRRRVFNAVLGQLQLEDNEGVIAELVEVYRNHRPKLELDGQVEQTLSELRADYKLGLITDGFMPGQQLKVEALGLEGFFEKIIYTEQLGRAFWKPATKSFEMMSEVLGCKGAECVYVADNMSKDFVGPNLLGWRTVRVRLAQSVHAEEGATVGEEPEVTIESINELPGLLRGQ